MIQEILIRLPVKSIIKSKVVCKPWRSLISDPSFARAHLKFVNRNPKSPDLIDSSDEMLLVCDEKGLNKRVLRIPPPVQSDVHSMLIGSCDGLICMIGNKKMAVFNPATRKYVSVPNPSFQKGYDWLSQGFWNDRHADWGFGFNPYANEYKIVHIYYEQNPDHGWRRAEVLTLGKDCSWRQIGECSAVVPYYEARYIGAALYWILSDPAILFFDLSEEKLGLIEAPKEKHDKCTCEIMDLNGRLCWVSAWAGQDGTVNLWALNEPVKNKSSWTLLCTINPSFLIRDPGSILFLYYIPRNKIIIYVRDSEVRLSYRLDFIVKNDCVEVEISRSDDMFFPRGAYVESLIPLPKV
ncbi:hypothetical protein LUZ60_005590 [Juncus effusus]|nr:hypothetical protein LUZ60_005590 [Juncus effusus]